MDYVLHISKAVEGLSSKRTIILIECGSGKSYLSFIANHYLTKVMNRSVRFICVDHNEQVISSSREAADSLNLSTGIILYYRYEKSDCFE